MMTKGRKEKPKYATQAVYVTSEGDVWSEAIPVMVGETRRKRYDRPARNSRSPQETPRSSTQARRYARSVTPRTINIHDEQARTTSNSPGPNSFTDQHIAQPEPLTRSHQTTPQRTTQREAETTQPSTSRGPTALPRTQRGEIWHNPASNPLGKSNIYADLGLYIDRPVPLTCFQCYFSGHAFRDCLCTILLKINNQIIRYDHDLGKHVVESRVRPIDQQQLNEIRAKWGRFLDGDNLIGEVFKSIWDVDRYLQSRGSEPLLKRIDECAPMQDRRSRVIWKKGPGPRQRVGRELYTPRPATQAQRMTALHALNS